MNVPCNSFFRSLAVALTLAIIPQAWAGGAADRSTDAQVLEQLQASLCPTAQNPIPPATPGAWVCTATLAPHAGVNSHAGKSVAVSRYPDGSVRAVFVGAPQADWFNEFNNETYTEAGLVFAYSPAGGWHLSDTVTPRAWKSHQHSGAALAAVGDLLVVGAPEYHDQFGLLDVYYDRTYGDPSAEIDMYFITGQNPLTLAQYGYALDISSNAALPSQDGAWLVVGSPRRGHDKGCIEVYRVSVTDSMQQIGDRHCGQVEGDKLGSSVAIRANADNTAAWVAAGAPPAAQGDALLAGEVRLFLATDSSLTAWQTLTAQTPVFLGAFGSSLAFDAENLYVGATGRFNGSGKKTGTVSVFTQSGFGWTFDRELKPGSDAENMDLCGASIAVADPSQVGHIAVGCPGTSGLVAKEGAVRLFRRLKLPPTGSYVWLGERVDMGDAPHGAEDLGRSVAFTGDTVFAGAPSASSDIAPHDGAVRIFTRDSSLFTDGFE